MNCKKCGFNLEPNATFCTNCGEPVANQNDGVDQVSTQPVVENVNNSAPTQPVMENAANVQQVERVAAPIMPNAPEAPLPGTQKIPVVDPVTEAPVDANVAAPINTPVNSTNNTPVSMVQDQMSVPNQQVDVVSQVSNIPLEVQGAPTVDPSEKPKKKSNSVVLIVILGVVIVAGGLLLILFGGKNMISSGKNSTTSSTSTSSTSTTTTTKPRKEELTLQGVKIFVPYGYKIDPASTQEEGIINSSYNENQIKISTITSQKFDEYNANFESLSSAFTEQGITVINSERKVVGERIFLGFTINVNGLEEYLCYTNVRDGSTIRFELVKTDRTIDESLSVFTEIAEFAVPLIDLQGE